MMLKNTVVENRDRFFPVSTGSLGVGTIQVVKDDASLRLPLRRAHPRPSVGASRGE